MMNQKREAEIWNRVMTASAESPCMPKSKPQDCLTAEQVMELLVGEQADACTYRTLAGRVKGSLRQQLLQLAQEEQGHYRKLEAVYYLMTGERPCPDRPKVPCISCTNEELRRRYEGEVEGARRYHCLAESAGSFESVMHCLGHDEERHSRVILQLLQMCL